MCVCASVWPHQHGCKRHNMRSMGVGGYVPGPYTCHAAKGLGGCRAYAAPLENHSVASRLDAGMCVMGSCIHMMCDSRC